MSQSILYLIPARKGSKGVPSKNTIPFGNSNLITLALNQAKMCANGNDIICLSSNDTAAISIAEDMGLEVPFIRPENLATDSAGMNDVIDHALNFYSNKGIKFECIVLLQPTSPLRKKEDILAVISKYDGSQEMIVTVNESKQNPYFNLFEEDKNGFLIKSKVGDFKTRQSLPACYTLNGAVYLIPVNVFLQKGMSNIKFIDKVIMPPQRSIDIDTKDDWDLAEYYFKKLNENN